MATNNAVNISASGVTGYDGAGTFNASAVTEHSLLIGGANNHTINSLGVATNGQIAIGSTGADPVLATLTPGSGVTIDNASGAIRINAVGGGLTWNLVSGSSASGASNNGYVAQSAGTVTVTLPSASSVGDIIAITGTTAATWKLAQNAGNQIFFGSSSTTAGAGGFLASTNIRDVVYAVCLSTNANWQVVSSIGNITVS